LQERRGPRDPEGLVTELVARDQKDGPRLSHPSTTLLPGSGGPPPVAPQSLTAPRTPGDGEDGAPRALGRALPARMPSARRGRARPARAPHRGGPSRGEAMKGANPRADCDSVSVVGRRDRIPFTARRLACTTVGWTSRGSQRTSASRMRRAGG